MSSSTNKENKKKKNYRKNKQQQRHNCNLKLFTGYLKTVDSGHQLCNINIKRRWEIERQSQKEKTQIHTNEQSISKYTHKQIYNPHFNTTLITCRNNCARSTIYDCWQLIRGQSIAPQASECPLRPASPATIRICTTLNACGDVNG